MGTGVTDSHLSYNKIDCTYLIARLTGIFVDYIKNYI
jgi:hypothetical protein